MAEVYTFGVVPADIGRYLPRIAFTAETAPTDVEALAIIQDHAADICAFLTGMGVDVANLDVDVNAAMYRQCQRYIIMRFAAQVMRMRNQNANTMADRLDEEATALFDRIRKMPQDMGAKRPVGIFSPNILHSNATYQSTLTSAQLNSGSRLAINSAADKM